MSDWPQTVTPIDEAHLVDLGEEYSMIIDFGNATVEDVALLFSLPKKADGSADDVKIFSNTIIFMSKVLGSKYLTLPLVYMHFAHKRVMDQLTFLLSSNEGFNGPSQSDG